MDLTKNIGAKVYKQFSGKVKEAEDGMLMALVNSGEEDRHGDVLDMKGLDTKKYMTNPILAYAHDYSMPSVGRTEKLVKTKDGKLKALFRFATDITDYALPRILDELYRKQYQFAFSIGFIPKEVEGNVYTKAEMIEFSPVLIGADDKALLLAMQKGLDLGEKKLMPEYENLIKKIHDLEGQIQEMSRPMAKKRAVMDLVAINSVIEKRLGGGDQ